MDIVDVKKTRIMRSEINENLNKIYSKNGSKTRSPSFE